MQRPDLSQGVVLVLGNQPLVLLTARPGRTVREIDYQRAVAEFDARLTPSLPNGRLPEIIERMDLRRIPINKAPDKVAGIAANYQRLRRLGIQAELLLGPSDQAEERAA